MEQRRRYLFVFFLAAFLLFLGIVFRQFFMANVILPVATVAWLMLRIFVLSIGQQVYWWALIFVIVIIALFRLLWVSETSEPDQVAQGNASLDQVARWRSSILSQVHEGGEDNALKRDLSWLLTSMYASKHEGFANFQIREAMLRREIPVPESVYTFLFAVEPVAPRQTFFKHPIGATRQTLAFICTAPRKWIRSWTGRDTAEYYHAIDEVLTLMETRLEMKHDDQPDLTRNH